MIQFRLNFDHAIGGLRITLEEYLSKARIEWHGVELGRPDWSDDSHSVAFTLHSFASSRVRYIAINAYWEQLEFELPPVADFPDAGWMRLIDTSLPSPDDVLEEGIGVPVTDAKYRVNPRSVVMLHYDYAGKH
jgi:isoamylase